MNPTRRSLATSLFAPLAARSAEAPTASNWFIRGNAQGDLVMIDMAQVSSVTRHQSPIDPQNPLVYGEVIAGSQQILFGKELMDAFVSQFGQWLVRA